MGQLPYSFLFFGSFFLHLPQRIMIIGRVVMFVKAGE